MVPFNPLIPRDLAIRLGAEAVEISKAGKYVGPEGQIDITAQVADSVGRTIYYGPDHRHALGANGPHVTKYEVTNETTLSAHRRHQSKGHNVVSLNFASATHPGGGFLTGARAQEEYLCRSSSLYLALKDLPMYGFHRAKGDHLYSDAMIYSPDVPVFRDDEHALLPSPYQASFITSAAPLARLLRDEDFEKPARAPLRSHQEDPFSSQLQWPRLHHPRRMGLRRVRERRQSDGRTVPAGPEQGFRRMFQGGHVRDRGHDARTSLHRSVRQALLSGRLTSRRHQKHGDLARTY